MLCTGLFNKTDLIKATAGEKRVFNKELSSILNTAKTAGDVQPRNRVREKLDGKLLRGT